MKRIPVFLLLCLQAAGAAAGPKDSLYAELKKAGTDTPAVSRLQIALGILHYEAGAFDSALVLLNGALAGATRSGDQEISVKALLNIGNVYADKGDNPRALGYYQQAMVLAEGRGDRSKAAHIRKNIGALYLSWKRFPEALAHYRQALQEATALGETDVMADCLNNMGTVYEQQGDYDRALDVYGRALEYYRAMRRKDRVAMALSNLAIVHKYRKDYARSVAYNKEACALAREIGDAWEEAAILNNTGSVYAQMGDVSQALQYARLACDKAREIGAREIVIAAYETMAEAAYNSGDFRNAYRYQKQFMAEQDSFLNIEQTRQLSELQVQYETQKKEKENAQLKLESQLKTADRERAERRSRTIGYVSLTAMAGLMLITFSVYRTKRLKARHEEARKISRAMFDSEQQERERVARDLHDSVGQMLSVVRMQMSQVEASDVTSEHLNRAIGLVDNTLQEVRHISHNLLPEGLNFGLVRGLEEMAAGIRAAGGPLLVMDLAESVRAYKFSPQSAFSLYRIVQEVTGNMLHHAEATEIKLDMDIRDERVILSLSDNGKGFDPAAIGRSEGIGWKNIRVRVGFLNGTMQVQSSAGKGTGVTIIIPQ